MRLSITLEPPNATWTNTTPELLKTQDLFDLLLLLTVCFRSSLQYTTKKSTLCSFIIFFAKTKFVELIQFTQVNSKYKGDNNETSNKGDNNETSKVHLNSRKTPISNTCTKIFRKLCFLA